MRKCFVLSMLCAAGLLLLSCTSRNVTRETHPILLGGLYNLSGAQASLDVPSSRGAQLAVDEANRTGGVLGRPLKLVLQDGETDPEMIAKKTIEMFEKYPSISALMGFSDTDMVLAAAPISARHQRLFLTSGATSPLLPAQVPEYLFLACIGDNVQAAAGAEWSYDEMSARTVSVLFNESGIYTRLLPRYFLARFSELGGRVLSMEGYTAGNIRKAIGRLKHADLIFLAAWPDEAAEAVEQLRSDGFRESILGGDSFDSQDLWKQHPNVAGVFYTTHAYLGADNPNPRVIAFRELYNKAYPNSHPDAFAALGYDTARLLMAAIEKAGSADPDMVRRAMTGMERFKGVTGDISYAGGNRVPRKSVSIIGVDRGKLKLVRELMPAKVPPPTAD